MKKILILAFAFSLLGCTTQPPKKDNSEVKSVNIKDIQQESINTVGLGADCGGTTQMHCGANLECKISINSGKSSGTCVETIVNKNLNCPKTQAPVCGKKNGIKNGYLNECEAERHGATVLNQGFCKPDETVAKNCNAKVTGIGNCEAVFWGFEFNAESSTCSQKRVSGCGAETPFNSLEDCQKSCVK